MTEVAPSSGVVRFAAFEVDLANAEVRKHGFRIRLQDQPFRVLQILLEHPGELITREELQRQIWPADTFVDFEKGLNNAVKRLRDTLGDSAGQPRIIETHAKRGYRFIAHIERLHGPNSDRPSQAGVFDHGLNAAVKRLRDAVDDSADSPRFIETLPRRGYRFISTIVADTIHAEQHWSLPKKWVLPLAVGAPVVIALAVLATDAGGLRSRFFSRSFAQPQIHSLAVLPLTNLSGDPDQEYFADGMTEELITELSRLSSLRVISRTSVMQYKGEKKKSVSQIGRELNVDAVMEGSVLRSGNRVRIAAHAIYAPTDQSLMAETYEDDLGDVLKLQREVAESITEKIRAKLTPEQQSRLHEGPKVNSEAYDAYLAATYQDFGLYQENKKAQAYLQKAIEKDPNFASAYERLGWTYIASAEQRRQPPQEVYPMAKQATRKALELDGKNCDAHRALGRISWRYDWDWQTAEKEFSYAIELCPSSASAHYGYSMYKAANGQFPEAQAEAVKLRELDPIRSEPLQSEAVINYHLRNYKALVEVCRSYTASSPNFWLPHYWLGVGFEGSGQTLEAIPEYQRAVELSQGDSDATASLAHAYATKGKRAEAEKILDHWLRQSETSFVSPYMIATVYAGLGEKDRAFEFLEKAYQIRSTDLPYFLRADLRLDSLRSDPRFQDLLHRMNFPQ